MESILHDAFDYWVLCIYFLLTFALPAVLANDGQEKTTQEDMLLNTIFTFASIMDTCYILLYKEGTCEGTRTVKKSRKCVSDIFAKLGPYYVWRAYWTTRLEFWSMYNLYPPFTPTKGRNRRKYRNYAAKNVTISFSLRLIIIIGYFTDGAPYSLMVS